MFSSKILIWYGQNKRTLPWRRTRDPYKIWLSEIMLQQTRVAQGTPYYLKFINTFPTVHDLADAPEEKVLKLWQGLGYYSRARNLHATSKMVVNEYNGHFPDNYAGLLKLKGIGDYTASAIASICFDEPHPVVDGNVYRVLARYFGISIPINSSEGVKYFKKLAIDVMDSDNIRDYNQGIMEFGAMQCTPKNPNCTQCPLNESCVALQEGKTATLPIKLKKHSIRTRYFNYLVPLSINKENDRTTILKQREGKGIWQNLWQFPLLETETEIDAVEIKRRYSEQIDLSGSPTISLFNENPIVHKLSHQHLQTKFWILETNEYLSDGIPVSNIKEYPVPVLIADFINAFKF